MDRIVLTVDEQATIDEFKATYPFFNADGSVYEGSNLVVDDNLQVDNSWEGVVLGGEGGLVWFFVPAWGLTLPIDLINYVTDRIGPDGETMPIFDPVVINPQCGPLFAAMTAQQKPRRPFAEVLRDSVERLSPLRKLRAHVALHKILDCHPHKRH